MCKHYSGWECGVKECKYFGDISGLCHNNENKKGFNQTCPIKGYDSKKENTECLDMK